MYSENHSRCRKESQWMKLSCRLRYVSGIPELYQSYINVISASGGRRTGQKTGTQKQSVHLTSNYYSKNRKYDILWHKCSHGVEKNTFNGHIASEQSPLKTALACLCCGQRRRASPFLPRQPFLRPLWHSRHEKQKRAGNGLSLLWQYRLP